MFLSLSKTMAMFGGFRLGLGIRLTKSNAIIMLFVIMFVAMFKAMLYMMILCLWLIYALIYGIVIGIKKLCQREKTD